MSAGNATHQDDGNGWPGTEVMHPLQAKQKNPNPFLQASRSIRALACNRMPSRSATDRIGRPDGVGENYTRWAPILDQRKALAER